MLEVIFTATFIEELADTNSLVNHKKHDHVILWKQWDGLTYFGFGLLSVATGVAVTKGIRHLTNLRVITKNHIRIQFFNNLIDRLGYG